MPPDQSKMHPVSSARSKSAVAVTKLPFFFFWRGLFVSLFCLLFILTWIFSRSINAKGISKSIYYVPTSVIESFLWLSTGHLFVLCTLTGFGQNDLLAVTVCCLAAW